MYEVAPLASTFGQLLTFSSGSGFPDPADVMERLWRAGALVLRGISADVPSFLEFSNACCASFSTYVGGGFRFRALDREAYDSTKTLLSTTGRSQSFSIPLHGEMYYQRQRPEVLWFYCQEAPAVRGQTTLADGAELFGRLTPATQRAFRELSVRYVRELTEADWQTTFHTRDRAELAAICERNEMRLTVRDDGSIETEFVDTAVQTLPDGTEVFVNSCLVLWEYERSLTTGRLAELLGGPALARLPLVARTGDGSPLPDAIMGEVHGVAEQLMIDVKWQPRDILLVDNARIMHGRRKTVGSDRQVLVRLGRATRPGPTIAATT